MTVPVVRFTVAGEDAAASPGLGRPYTVVYDGTCKVCGRLVKLLRAWDRRHEVEVVPSQQPGVMARFPWIPAPAYAEAVQLIGPGGRTWSGAAAVEQLLNVLPKGRLLSWFFKIPFMRRFADRFYKWFARNRYQFGCGEHCQARPMDVIFREAEEAAKS
ncbi:MAG: thiol-disulfide oxidoreductase DCC family protein [Gemmatimonadaceae bacterium]